jgi:hypothetical protein
MSNEQFSFLTELSKNELLSSTKNAVKSELQAMSRVLEHLAEIERRQLHVEAGHSSLHAFMVHELGYSDGSACRRISAMRLCRSAPEIKQAIHSGEISLSNASLIQNVLKIAKKQGVELNTPISTLAESVKNCSARKAERNLLKFFPDIITKLWFERDSIRIKDANTAVITINVPAEFEEQLNELRAIHAHQLGNATIGELIQFAVEQTLRKTKKIVSEEVVAERQSTTSSKTVATPTSEFKKKSKSRHISTKTKESVRKRDLNKCQFVSPLTGKKCESNFGLQFDHIKPFSQDGPPTEENLELLCSVHNLWKSDCY